MSDLTAVSLFGGIGGIDRALELAGVKVTAAVEIDPDCRGVLRRHFPDAAMFNDVTEVTGDQLRATGFVPGHGILTGGFPCQGLSVAGLRKGLADARSGLFWHVMRLADELRPRWLLLENVPGLLSSVCPCPGDGTCVAGRRAMACGEWRGDRDTREWFPDVPHTVSGGACPGGCMAAHGGAMGTVLGALGERGYGFAYRVLDAQFFGVPQRRRRVFIAGCLGDRAAPVQVLLEPESGEGNPASRGTARPRTARTPGVGAISALQGGGRRGHRIDAEGAAGGQLIPAIAYPLVSGGNDRHDESQMTYVTMPTLTASRGTNHGAPGHGGKDEAVLAVTHAITAREGKGPDSDATTGFITVPVALRGRDEGSQIEVGQPGEPAFTVRGPGGGSSYPMVAHALTAEGADASEDGTGRGTPLVAVPMAFNPQTGGSKGLLAPAETPTALQASQVTAVRQDSAVRRLTPMECERLQGFPDRWTLHQADGSEQSDSARYRQLGNSVAVPCVAWITRRIAAVEAASEARGAA